MNADLRKGTQNLNALLNLINLTNRGLLDRLDFSRRPANLGLFDVRILADAEVQTSLVLRAETTATRNLLHLLAPIPEQTHLRADRTAIARRAFEFETDPLVLGVHVVLVNQQRFSSLFYTVLLPGARPP